VSRKGEVRKVYIFFLNKEKKTIFKFEEGQHLGVMPIVCVDHQIGRGLYRKKRPTKNEILLKITYTLNFRPAPEMTSKDV
jgi:hypothetical protein